MSNYKHRKQWAGKDKKFLSFLEALYRDDPNNYPATKTEAKELYAEQESEYIVAGFGKSCRISDEQGEAREPQDKAGAGEFRSGEKADIQDAKGDLNLLSRPTHTNLRPSVRIKREAANPSEKEIRSGVKAEIQDAKGDISSKPSSDPTNPVFSPSVARRPAAALTPLSTTSKKQADKYNYDNNLMTDDDRTYYEATNALTPAAKKEYDYNNAKMSDSQKERYERSSGKYVQNPTLRGYPIKIYCGAGKHCGYRVDYTVGNYPNFCNGENSKRNYCRIGTNDRINHQCLFADVVCAHNRCLIDNAHLADLLNFHCCPNCRRHLHGGISSQYGIVFH